MDPRAGVTPSIRNFAHAIDRQRQALERIPLLDAGRADIAEAARALDEAEAAAIAIAAGDDLARFGVAARAVSIPVMRADLLAEEFRIYESRTAGGHAEAREDRKSTRLNSSHGYISYAVFCLEKKK